MGDDLCVCTNVMSKSESDAYKQEYKLSACASFVSESK